LQSQKVTDRAWIGLKQNIMNGESISLPVFT